MPTLSRRASRLALALLLVLPALSGSTAPALASGTQVSILEDDAHLFADPPGVLQRMRNLGVTIVRVDIKWLQVAPRAHSYRKPAHFNGREPTAYPARNWAVFDEIVKLAQQDGIRVYMDINGGAPLWATGPGAPPHHPHPNWNPSPRLFGQFVEAVAIRYSGSYFPPGASSPLPRVDFWSIWNEPDLGFELAPQGVPGHLDIENSGRMYRALLASAWGALQRTGHGSDTILIGELSGRGAPQWGVFNSMKPLVFLRALYCVDSHYHQLRGNAARMRGCPTTSAGSRSFRSRNPALFESSGFAQHMHMRWYPPCCEARFDPDNATLGLIGNLQRALDRVQRAYGSSRRYPIYNTEFGYVTSPPNKHPFPSPTTAAFYLNWAEYITWRRPRLVSFDQYLLRDGRPNSTNNGGWADGLLTFRNRPKPTFSAWRLPIYLPVRTARRGRSLEVWGCARPLPYAMLDTGGGQPVDIQFQPASGGPFRTLKQITITNSQGYFDTRVTFPRTGFVRLSWSYPSGDPLLPSGLRVFSRHVHVSVQ